jgi:dUTP pyrophosphatase
VTTESVPVLLHRLDEDLPVPAQAHPGDAGLDLRARHGVTLEPGERSLVATGVAIALPDGYAGFVHPRSGLAARHGITVVNAPGTVDAGYRGEIQVCLLNTDRTQAFTVARGDRIAQLVVQPVSRVAFTEVRRLPGSARGERGHGASGGFGAATDLITTDTKD